MKQPLILVLLFVAVWITGCAHQEYRSFFASDGISVGTPVMVGAGSYQIPILFETEIIHSGQWIDRVSSSVTGTNIMVTASFTSHPQKTRYPGHIELNGVSGETYDLMYRDPDSTLHLVGQVVLP